MFESYIYLLSSLPMLHFGSRQSFSYQKFLSLCEGSVSQGDLALLRELPDLCVSCFAQSLNKTAAAMLNFERLLRNELVKARAPRFHADPAKYLHGDGNVETNLTHIAQTAYRNPSIIEGERALDAARWERLEELSMGHYFDMEALVIYAWKLLILERWENIRKPQAKELLESLI